MKKFSVMIFLPFLLYACGSSKDSVDVRAEEPESRDFSSSQIQKLEVDTENGNIQSSARDDDSLTCPEKTGHIAKQDLE